MSGTGWTLETEGYFQALDEDRQRIVEAGASALYGEGQLIMTDSKENYVPVETGVLRSSGTVDDPEVSGDGLISVQLSFGGAAFAYALYQHERLDLRHTTGQAKYLETPMTTAAAGFDERLAAEISRRLGR